MSDRIILKFLVIVLIRFQNVQSTSQTDLLVYSNVGLIRGLRATDGEYSMFMGIPYATVDPANPFGPSIPHAGFHEIFEAYDDSSICPQIEEFNNTIVGSLDCLHLNIYVPNSATSTNRLPVLVWIYGGGYAIGFAGRYIYGPRYLVKHDIILVTINYRLGPYGFMCLDVPEVSGNQGLKDQETALKWITNNIDAFGGDTGKITISGNSAGSILVDLHLHYSRETLFNQVIMQSGSATGPWAIAKSDKSAAQKLSAHLGFATNDTADALKFLSTIDTNLIISASSDINLSLGPCVEQDYNNVDKFISDYPINIQVSKVSKIPVLIGHNDDERLAFYANREPEYFDNLNIFYNQLKPYFNFNHEEMVEMEEIVRHFYNGDNAIDAKSKRNIQNFDSDFIFNHPIERSIKKFIDNGAPTVYFYVFSYVGGRNFIRKKINITYGGASHADEIGYIFDLSYESDDPTPEDQLIIDRITTLWANFVKFGNPTPQTTDLLPVQWTPVSKDIRYYLSIDTDMSLQTRPFAERIAFWDLFYRLNDKKQIGYKKP